MEAVNPCDGNGNARDKDHKLVMVSYVCSLGMVWIPKRSYETTNRLRIESLVTEIDDPLIGEGADGMWFAERKRSETESKI